MADTLISRSDGLVTITFNRPHKKNALTAANWSDLDRAVREVARNPADRALILTGAGGCFSSGAEIASDGDLGNSSLLGNEPQPIIHEVRSVNEIIGQLQRLAKPTLALVDGVAIGVALGLALACDFIIATKRARFAEVFVQRGLSLDGGTSWSLPHAVGVRRAKEMAFFGDMVGAEDALRWGLINRVVPAEDLQKTGLEWGRRLADGPSTTISLIKRLIDDSWTSSFEDSLEQEARAQHVAVTTDDAQEGLRAFGERREPRFTGR